MWIDFKKSRIRETKHRSTDADSITNTKKILLVRQNSPKQNFFGRRFYTLYKQKFSKLRPILSLTFPQGFWKSKKFGHWTLRSGDRKTFKWSEQMNKNLKKKKKKKIRGYFTPFMSKSFKIWDHFFPLLFPKDSKNLIGLDIGLWEVGAKRSLNGVRNTYAKKILFSKAEFAQIQTFFARQFYTL